MGSSREYWLCAKECAKWAAETKHKDDQDLFVDMAKAWTNIAHRGDVQECVAAAVIIRDESEATVERVA